MPASIALDMPQHNDTSRSPFRHRDFRIFWTGSFCSSFGSQFNTVAMAWQIYELTHSPFQIGLLGLARALPQIVLLLFAGLLADAINRRKLMIWTQTGHCCVSASLALLTFWGKASPRDALRRDNTARALQLPGAAVAPIFHSQASCRAMICRGRSPSRALSAMCP